MFVVGILPLLLTLFGGSQDLLDHIPTNVYWQAKAVQPAKEVLLADLQADGGGDLKQLIKELGSDEFGKREVASRKILAKGSAAIAELQDASNSTDPEISNRARGLIEELSNRAPAQKVRRLMAIRTLGEIKEKEALPLLGKLLDSKEPFIADYAKRAIASIEGKSYAREPTPPATEDLWLLPAGCAVVGQVRAAGNQAFSLEKLLENIPENMGPPRQEMLQQAYDGMIKAAEMVGNIRIDSATVGVSSDFVEGQPRFVVLEMRGQFDHVAVMNAIKKNEKTSIIEGQEVFDVEGGAAGKLAFINDNRAVLIQGPNPDKLPSAELFGAISKGKGKLETDQELTKLIKTTDTQTQLWVVAKISESYRQYSIVAPFDNIVLSGKRKENVIAMDFRAQGADEAKVKAAVEQFQQQLDMGKSMLRPMAAMMPMAKPLADFLDSIKCEVHGAQAGFTATLNDMELFGGSSTDAAPKVPAQKNPQ